MNDPISLEPNDEFNKVLLLHTHPVDWINPQPKERYDLVVVGGGTAGLVTAAGGAGLGAKVALVERNLLGGDCLNFGCVPSKAILRSSRAAAEAKRAQQLGVRVVDATVDFPAVMQRMRSIRASISKHDSANRFQSLGVDVFLGSAEFARPGEIRVGETSLRYVRAVIATGGRPRRPEIPGLEEIGYRTNETIFSLTQLPKRMAVLGAGPIGCELAQCFARLGSQVVLITDGDRILPKDDPQAAAIVHGAMIDDGVQILLSCQVTRAEKSSDGKSLVYRQKETEGRIDVDEILVGVGRQPNVAGLGLDNVGVKYDARDGVRVDDRLRTTNRRIYAAGDVCSRFQFTHAADAMARIVLQNSLFFGRARVGALTIPSCTYTDPESAKVGLNEVEAARLGVPIRTFVAEMSSVDRAILDGQTAGFVKIHVRAGTDVIVGAAIVAAHAGEMISEISLAMHSKVGLSKLASVIHPYPTQAEGIKKVADSFNRSRLTPRVARLLRWLIALRRVF